MGFRIVALADPIGGPRRIEVAQAHVAQVVGFVVPLEGTLEGELGVSIGIDGQLRIVLDNGSTL